MIGLFLFVSAAASQASFQADDQTQVFLHIPASLSHCELRFCTSTFLPQKNTLQVGKRGRVAAQRRWREEHLQVLTTRGFKDKTCSRFFKSGNLANRRGEGMLVDEQQENGQSSSSTCSKAKKGEFWSSFDRELRSDYLQPRKLLNCSGTFSSDSSSSSLFSSFSSFSGCSQTVRRGQKPKNFNDSDLKSFLPRDWHQRKCVVSNSSQSLPSYRINFYEFIHICHCFCQTIILNLNINHK